jgi:hypothetical protein
MHFVISSDISFDTSHCLFEKTVSFIEGKIPKMRAAMVKQTLFNLFYDILSKHYAIYHMSIS